MDDQERNWKQYETQIDLYKFYLDLVVKINAFHFAISGAIISFYFANRDTDSIQWALLLPAVLSICLVLFFAFGAVANLVSRKNVIDLAKSLKLGVAPELLVLTVFLVIFCLANLLAFVGAVYVMYAHSCLSV